LFSINLNSELEVCDNTLKYCLKAVNWLFMRLILSIFVVLVLVPMQVQALYRWVDSKGVVHYSDQVPPSDADKERKILDKTGKTLKTIDRAKTKDELAEAKRRATLEAKRLKILKKQKEKDRVLLMTYQSLAEIYAARDVKISTVENAILISQSTLKSQKKKLGSLRHTAAEFERGSRNVPKRVIDKMKAVQSQITLTNRFINRKRKEQNEIRKEFAVYASRYKHLTE